MTYPPLPPTVIEPIIRMALAEDFGTAGDVTANLLVPEAATATLYFKSRDTGVLAGLQPAAMTFAMICLLYTSPSPRDQRGSRMPSSA